MCQGCCDFKITPNLKYTFEEKMEMLNKMHRFLAEIEVWRQNRHITQVFGNRADIIFKGGKIYTMD